MMYVLGQYDERRDFMALFLVIVVAIGIIALAIRNVAKRYKRLIGVPSCPTSSSQGCLTCGDAEGGMTYRYSGSSQWATCGYRGGSGMITICTLQHQKAKSIGRAGVITAMMLLLLSMTLVACATSITPSGGSPASTPSSVPASN